MKGKNFSAMGIFGRSGATKKLPHLFKVWLKLWFGKDKRA